MPINNYIFLAIGLFAIGIVGVLTRRNAIIIFMCIELMLNAVNLLLVAFSKMHHLAAVDGRKHLVDGVEKYVNQGHEKFVGLDPVSMATVGTDGQLFVFFIMVVAAAEVSVGLAIIVMMYRNIHSVDVNFLNRLKH
jgi:NADH-quinone oxidoreductase subunit K